jgi:hypothetical protein
MSASRRQFSLQTLLLMVFATGVLMFAIASHYEVRTLRTENQKMREELGILDIADRSKSYIRSVKAKEDKTWRWRMYLPKEKYLSVGLVTHDIPRSERMPGMAAQAGKRTFPAGEFELSVYLQQDVQGRWQAVFETPNGRSRQLIEPQHSEWITRSGFSSSSDVSSTSAEIKLGQPVVLLHLNEMMKAGPPDTKSPGLLVWLADETK